jgi:hypothetical protein
MGPVCTFDEPAILNCSVTPIPASSSPTLQVVASTPHYIRRMQMIDGVDECVGLYGGAPGSEILLWIIGNSRNDAVPLNIPAGTRLSIRNMADATISSGILCGAFYGW